MLRESYEYLFEFRIKPALEVPEFGGIALLYGTYKVKFLTKPQRIPERNQVVLFPKATMSLKYAAAITLQHSAITLIVSQSTYAG